MSLLQMSLQGGGMILAITVLRALAMNRVPKKTFLALWAAALARLLVPFSLLSALSIYALMERESAAVAVRGPVVRVMPVIPAGQVSAAAAQAGSAAGTVFPLWTAVWVLGALLCAAFFAAAYWRCCREFRMSLPVEHDFARRWMETHPLWRRLSIRQSDRVSSPLTFGILRPVILLPKDTDWEDEAALAYVLEHELVHIQRFDALSKLLLTAALCAHWFNPLVWAMYVLANRDLELSCDETVVRRFGRDRRAAYARVLIHMEETRGGLTPLCSHFSQNAMEERINAIMKTKKTTAASLILAAVLVAGTVTVFATTPQESVDDIGKKPGPETAHAVEGGAATEPDQELLDAGLTYRDDTWFYQGKAVAGMYDDKGGIYTNDAAESDVYLAVKRGSDGKITEFVPITRKQFRELVDRHMNLAPVEPTEDEDTLMSYVDPTDGKTYYSFDDGKTFQPLADAEFEALYPTPDIEWWTYDEFKAWLDEEKIQLQGMLGEKGWTGGEGYFVWTQEKIDETIALYEEMLADIKNGVLYSKTVDGQEDVLVSFSPADVTIGMSADA